MSYFSGIVSCHFSIDSELLAGTRDLRVKIDEMRFPLSEVLNRVWTLKHIPDSVIAQHEILVFLTEKGAPVFFKNSDTPELRSQALNLKTATVQNYAQLEITCLKISAETQRERGAAEEEEALLKSIDDEEKKQQTTTSSSNSSLNIHDQQARNNSSNQQQNPLDLAGGSSSSSGNNNKQSGMMSESEEFKRKAALNAKRLPLYLPLDGLSDEITNDEERKAANCRLCDMPIRIKSSNNNKSSSSAFAAMQKKLPPMMMMGFGQKVKPAACCPNPNSRGRCQKVCCDVCYDYAFSMKMMSMKCPICGGDKNTKLVNDGTAGSSSSSATTVRVVNHHQQQQDGDDNDLEVVERDPKKVRRIE